MKKVAVILSGCGVFDGAEIHESVLTLLALDKVGAQYQCLAPDRNQQEVINHLTGEATGESRNILVESARIARGDATSLSQANPADFDAAIVPGGFGAAKNLCNFASQGANCQIQPDIQQFIQAMHQAGKPLGFICIAPVMIPGILGQPAQLTIGNDANIAGAVNQMGGQHVDCAVEDIVVDEALKVVSTPAYMLAQSISQAATGIEKLVHRIIEL